MGSIEAKTDAPELPPPELAQCLRELETRIRQLERDLAASERAREVDPASGLPNRNAFARNVDGTCAAIALGDPRPGVRAALLILGVDRLAAVREALGFGAADEVARRIGERVRDAAAPECSVARVGDNEFALLLAGPESSAELSALARRIGAAVELPMRAGEDDLRLMSSIGIACAPQDGTNAETLLARAQAAMRHASRAMRGTHQFFHEDIGRIGARQLHVEAELRGALDRGEFAVHYQPRRRLRGQRIIGVEALLRWNHPERGLLAAGEFIDVANETGLITPIGEVVLRQACKDAAKWPRHVALSVNLSPREFRGARLESIIDAALADSGLSPQRFQLEITEASLVGALEETDVALVRLTALRERGVRVVLDNFGTGSCSLDLLRRCRAEFVKIDSRLIQSIPTDRDGTFIVRTMAAMARLFGAAVIAEGIEEMSQLDGAIRAGCTEGQGYFLGRPMTVGELLEVLADEPVRASDHDGEEPVRSEAPA